MTAFTISQLDAAPRVPFRFDGRILYTSGRYELVHLTLQPGEGMEPHSQPFDVVFFLIAGTGTLNIEGEEHEIGENNTVCVPKGAQRAWSNRGEGPLRILVNKLMV
jgi:mannose-6-phosphate isomerase-like protein (cupin superfamily)